MKRLMTLLALCIILTGCSQKNYILDNELIELSQTDKADFSSLLAEVLDNSKDNYLSNGIRILNCDDIDKIHSAEKIIYPVFENDKIKYIISSDQLEEVITLNEPIECKDDDEIAFISINDNIYLYRNGECIPAIIYNETGKDEERIMKQLEESRKYISVRLRTNMVRIIEKPDVFYEEGIKVSAKRIAVKFAEGDIEEFIEKYQQFCNGLIVSRVDSANMYVFEFEALTSEEMHRLINNSEALDYVISASMEGISDMHPAVNNRKSDK